VDYELAEDALDRLRASIPLPVVSLQVESLPVVSLPADVQAPPQEPNRAERPRRWARGLAVPGKGAPGGRR
jgi:hypothetical protein